MERKLGRILTTLKMRIRLSSGEIWEGLPGCPREPNDRMWEKQGDEWHGYRNSWKCSQVQENTNALKDFRDHDCDRKAPLRLRMTRLREAATDRTLVVPECARRSPPPGLIGACGDVGVVRRTDRDLTCPCFPNRNIHQRQPHWYPIIP